ncbi:carboxypeptidase-like regulatory domain-containing protein [Cloacibacterium caeni]|uniref:carboxypeptidase-like regulatory domain-containing protein n=1 Tax=Cloacibacterium caeni TaxID=2004710 RepID=UPI0020217F8D|nr:carboxypeptidase-like regulatory domain-containing protein [Cloacibacterium caeni]
MYKKLITSLLLLVTTVVLAQVGSVTISVFDEFSKKPISATVKIQNFEQTFTGNGSVSITDLMSGNYNFEIFSEGYDVGFLNDINVVPNQNLTFSIGLNKSAKQIQEVTLTKKLYKTTAESPISLRNITSEEVQKNAGSNRDVSKAILSFPGVGSTATF